MSRSERESLLRSRSDSFRQSYGSSNTLHNPEISGSRTFLLPQGHRHLIPGVIVLFLVLLERVAFYSLTANLYLFLNQSLFGWKSYNAMSALLIFTGVAYVSSLFGGMLADSLLGRFKTLILGFLLFTGSYWFLPFLSNRKFSPYLWNLCSFQSDLFEASNTTVTPAVPEKQLYEEPCCPLMLSLIILAAIGTGTVKANITPFGAEQVRYGGPDSLKIYLNWFYWCVNIGAFIAILGIAYIQQAVSFFLGYLVPAICVSVATVLLLLTYPVYTHQSPSGSAISRILSIMKEAFKSNRRFKARRNQSVESISSCQLSNPSPSWLDMAKVKYGGKFHESAVEDVKALGTILIVFTFLIPYWLLYFQMQTTFLAQGLHMRLELFEKSANCSSKDNTFYIPAAWLTLFDIIFLLMFIPLMDRVIYPFLDKRGLKIPMLMRMLIGMLFATLSMLTAGVLETYRLKSVGSGTICQFIENTPYYAADLSIFWQIPQYSLMGISEVFTSVAGMEFACSQAPSSIQGAIMGLFYFCAGIGSFLGSILLVSFERVDGIMVRADQDIGNINYGNLDYYFFALAGIQFATLIIFCFISKRLKIRKQPITTSSRFGSRFNSPSNEINRVGDKLRRSTRKKNNLSGLQYREMENNQATPVKLYSPFGFVTPSPHKEALITPRKRRLTPKRFMFVSPTGKLKKDIEDLSSGIQELHTVAKSINKKRNKKLY